MRTTFIQGIVRTQVNFLVANAPTGINFAANNSPTLLTFAHGTGVNYLFLESQPIVNAWTGPFTNGTTYYLYWDINLITGARTFGKTTLAPIAAAVEPTAPGADQHWFDTVSRKMFVRTGARWIEKVRVFAGSYVGGGALTMNSEGSQVGVNVSSVAGFILIDDENKAVKSFDRSGNGKFITTETPLASQRSSSTNVKVEASIIQGLATESLASFSPVNVSGVNGIGLARTSEYTAPAMGITLDDAGIGEVVSVMAEGYLKSLTFNFTATPGSPIFVSATGTLTTTVPTQFSLQEVATVLSPTEIYIKVKPLIRLEGPTNIVPMFVDMSTGTMAAVDIGLEGGPAAAISVVYGDDETIPNVNTFIFSDAFTVSDLGEDGLASIDLASGGGSLTVAYDVEPEVVDEYSDITYLKFNGNGINVEEVEPGRVTVTLDYINGIDNIVDDEEGAPVQYGLYITTIDGQVTFRSVAESESIRIENEGEYLQFFVRSKEAAQVELSGSTLDNGVDILSVNGQTLDVLDGFLGVESGALGRNAIRLSDDVSQYVYRFTAHIILSSSNGDPLTDFGAFFTTEGGSAETESELTVATEEWKVVPTSRATILNTYLTTADIEDLGKFTITYIHYPDGGNNNYIRLHVATAEACSISATMTVEEIPLQPYLPA